MTKAEVTADLRRHCGGSSFVTRKELMTFLGYSCPKRVDKYLQGLERINKNKYFIPDVSESILRYKS